MGTLVDAETGEVQHLSDVLPADGWVSGTGQLDEAQARTLTSKIKGYVARSYVLIREAHDRGAWKAMGYKSWADYVRVEFDMSRSYAYRLISQAQVVAELEAAAEVSPIGDSRPLVTESQARAIAPIVSEVAAVVAEAVADLPAEAVEERAEVARETVRATVSKTTDTNSPAIAALRAKRASDSQPEPQIDEAVVLRQSLSRALVKQHDLLGINPERAAAVALPEDRHALTLTAQHMRRWADAFETALTPNLRSVK